MRQLAVYFALIYSFQFGIGEIWPGRLTKIKNLIYNPSIKDSIRVVIDKVGNNHKNKDNDKDDSEILKNLTKICFMEMSLENGNSGTDAKDINLNTSNINSLESNIKLPAIKMPNITVIIVEDEPSNNCSNNNTSNCQGQKNAPVLQRTKKVDAAEKSDNEAVELIKKCVSKKLQKT